MRACLSAHDRAPRYLGTRANGIRAADVEQRSSKKIDVTEKVMRLHAGEWQQGVAKSKKAHER